METTKRVWVAATLDTRATKPTINVGNKLYRAADIRDLPEKLSRSPFPGQYCGQWMATHEETPHGIFFEAPEEEIKHSTIEPNPS
jgi:hypothetical protein